MLNLRFSTIACSKDWLALSAQRQDQVRPTNSRVLYPQRSRHASAYFAQLKRANTHIIPGGRLFRKRSNETAGYWIRIVLFWSASFLHY